MALGVNLKFRERGCLDRPREVETGKSEKGEQVKNETVIITYRIGGDDLRADRVGQS